MTDPIALIITLTGCLEEEARRVLDQVDGDVVEAVDQIVKHVPCPSSKVVPPPRKRTRDNITPEEAYLNSLRPTMENMETRIQASITSNQRADAISDATPDHREGTAPQSSCFQECRLPSIEEEVQTPETESQ